jgi:hypothetical protein
MRILAFDPGGTTGWCSAYIDEDGVVDLVDYGQLTGDHHYTLQKLLANKKPDIIICERFEKRNNDFSLLISCEYIGIIKASHQKRDVILIMQGASAAKSFMSDAKLLRLNARITPATNNGHANDARRHLMYFLATADHSELCLQMARYQLLQKLK